MRRLFLVVGLAFSLVFLAHSAAAFGQSRMPLLMPDDFIELNLVGWRVELGTPDARNPLIEGHRVPAEDNLDQHDGRRLDGAAAV